MPASTPASRVDSAAHAYRPVPAPQYKWPETVGPKWGKKVFPWLEEFWHNKKRFPSDSELVQRFGFTEEELFKFHHSRYILKGLERRGIVPPSQRGQLTPEQVAAITLISNVSDTRSEQAKMAAIGVSVQQLHGWMRDETFQRELAQRVDEMLDNLKPAANAALARQIHKGNFPALKFYYELTGQAQSPEMINLKATVGRLVEIIELHVKDAETLDRIARDFQRALEVRSTSFDPSSKLAPPVAKTSVAGETLTLQEKYAAFQEQAIQNELD